MARQTKGYFSCLVDGGVGKDDIQPSASCSQLSSQTTSFSHNTVTSLHKEHLHGQSGTCCRYFHILFSFSLEGMKGQRWVGGDAEDTSGELVFGVLTAHGGDSRHWWPLRAERLSPGSWVD